VSPPVIALAGAPNVGKSTLFNRLTGAGVAMGNWPGTSTEFARGTWRPRGDGLAEASYTLIDLPGAYSLDAASAGEQAAADLLGGRDRPDATIVVADAAHLARSLYLVAQMRETDARVVVALTMADVAARRGLRVDAGVLGRRLGSPVVLVDPRRRKGEEDLAAAVRDVLQAPAKSRPVRVVSAAMGGHGSFVREDERFAWIERAVSGAVTEVPTRGARWGDRLDRWVLAPVVGPLIFLAAMWIVLQATTLLATPLQHGLDMLFTRVVAGGARAGLGGLGLRGTWIEGLAVDGLIGGVGMVLSFAPLMTIMFALLALLEDSGYLARAAVVTDSTMRRLGLPGQAFLPLIVGFGCNVPAIAATRILPRREHRLLTVLLVPFTSCTARLTVYLLVGSVFFGRWAGTVVFAMYVVSVLLVVGVGIVLRRALWRGIGDQPMVLDLPPYQHPTVSLIAAVTWQRLRGFLQTAGGIIVAAVVVVWLLEAIPAGPGVGGFGDVPLDHSVLAGMTRAAAPVFAWAGFGDWRLVAGLLVGFVAKEAVISTWAQTFTVVAPGPGHVGGLGDAVHEAFAAASGGHELAAVAAFLVFLLAYTPCAATLASQVREIGARWTAFGMAVQLTLAWVLAVVVFRIGVMLA